MPNELRDRFQIRPRRVSDAGMAGAVDLAACYRLMDRFGMTDLIYNHITARIPGTEFTC